MSRVRYCIWRNLWLHHLLVSVLNCSIDLREEWLCCAILFESLGDQVSIVQLLRSSFVQDIHLSISTTHRKAFPSENLWVCALMMSID